MTNEYNKRPLNEKFYKYEYLRSKGANKLIEEGGKLQSYFHISLFLFYILTPIVIFYYLLRQIIIVI